MPPPTFFVGIAGSDFFTGGRAGDSALLIGAGGAPGARFFAVDFGAGSTTVDFGAGSTAVDFGAGSTAPRAAPFGWPAGCGGAAGGRIGVPAPCSSKAQAPPAGTTTSR